MSSRVPLKSGFSVSSSPLFSSSSAIYSAIAADDESPGESIAAAWISPFTLSDSFIIKSPFFSDARTPEKEVITARVLTPGTLFFASSATVLSPPAVVSVLSGVSTLSAVGPKSKLPSAVGVTKMPLPFAVGTWNIVCDTVSPSLLSSSIYSPARGIISKNLSPAISAILSAKPPAQFTRYRAVICLPSAEQTLKPSSALTIAVTS